MSGISRRSLLATGIGTGAGTALGVLGLAGLAAPGQAYAAPSQPPIRSRAEWAGNLPANTSLEVEADGDVRFLIVHHSASPNTERPGSIPGRLRGFHAYHTTTKQWPDVAYNFFVDPFGTIWEGRAGSLTRPVRGDATGGSQGFAQLCCFVGDHASTPPTPAAMQAMTALLAWLAGRYEINLAAGKSIRFTSRGSNRWPRGAEVVTDPIVGHRDMSQTTCPGDALYPLIRAELLVGAQRLTGVAEPPPVSAPATTPVPADETQPDMTPTTPPATEANAGRSATTQEEAAKAGSGERLGDLILPIGAATAVVGGAAVAGGLVLGRKRD